MATQERSIFLEGKILRQRYRRAWIISGAAFLLISAYRWLLGPAACEAWALSLPLGLGHFVAGGCSFLEAISEPLIDGFVVVCVVELVLHQSQSEQVAAMIVTTLEEIFGGKNKQIFSSLSGETKNMMVRNSLEDVLGETYGGVFYEQIVSAYLGREVAYRQGFEYHVTCHDDLGAFADLQELNEKERRFHGLVATGHLWVEQDLRYTRHGVHKDKPLPEMVARFAFSQQQLTRFIASENDFFREILRIPDAACALLLSMTANEIDHFVRNVLTFRAFSATDGTALPFTVAWANEDGAGHDRYLEIRITNPSGCYEGSGCRISFVLPHRHLETEFLVTLPQPIKPKGMISFTKADSMGSLSYIPFISKFRGSSYEPVFDPTDGDPNKITITIHQWAFPTGGLMFVWKQGEK